MIPPQPHVAVSVGAGHHPSGSRRDHPRPPGRRPRTRDHRTARDRALLIGGRLRARGTRRWRSDRRSPRRSRTGPAPCLPPANLLERRAGNITIGGRGGHTKRHAETGVPTPRSASSRRSANARVAQPLIAAAVAALVSASLGSAWSGRRAARFLRRGCRWAGAEPRGVRGSAASRSVGVEWRPQE